MNCWVKSMINVKKIKTYVGFSIKSKTIIYGVDSIKESIPYVVIYSENLAESSKGKLLENLKEKNCPFYEISKEDMLEIFQNENIKVFAIKNKELARAIIENI